MSDIKDQLLKKIETRRATIGVIGLGWVGLGWGVGLGEAGFTVIGVDTDPGRLGRIRQGESPVEDVPKEQLAPLVLGKRFSVSDDGREMEAEDAILIAVPTPLRKSKDPDVSHIVAASKEVTKVLRSGQLIILESTTYPGTTEEILLPQIDQGRFQVGRDVFLAFSPERIDPGNQRYSLRQIPKLVGGVTPRCSELAAALYRQIIDRVIPVSSPRVAEMSKLFENIFRSVNIALVNELAIMCRRLGISVWEVIDSAATKPFGFLPFYPGPGIGGHCIPVDPYYLSWKSRLAGYEPRFMAFADEINRSMPGYVVELLTDALNHDGKPVKGSSVLILGVAYKPGVGDARESPAIEILSLLLSKGARVSYTDPYVPTLTVPESEFKSVEWSTIDFGRTDAVLLLTDHPGFDYEIVCRSAPLVVDTRNATQRVRTPKSRIVTL